MALYTASRPVPLAAQRLLATLARAGAGRLLPGRPALAPPAELHDLFPLWDDWSALVGRRIDGVAVYRRPQRSRTGIALMLCAGRHSAIVRLRRDPAELDLEYRLCRRAEQDPPVGFRVPAVLGRGRSGGWHWAAYAAISRRPHGPARRIGPEMTGSISRLVEAVVPRPADVPAHWRGAHRDLTPWNLRRTGGTTWLLDWEDAGWAPPDADALFFAVNRAAMRNRQRPGSMIPWDRAEAAAYWRAIVAARPTTDSDSALRTTLLRLLDTGAAGGTGQPAPDRHPREA